jgi:hypothetical protein
MIRLRAILCMPQGLVLKEVQLLMAKAIGACDGLVG